MSGGDIKLVGFLCNWCSYAGADMAGTSRMAQPAEMRIVRLPCTGRVNPLLVLKAFQEGADGVLVSGCHPGDCHYNEGNYYAHRRLELLSRMMAVYGIEPERFRYTWISASEGARWAETVTGFTETIRPLGRLNLAGGGARDDDHHQGPAAGSASPAEKR
ncbi:methyl-viologen-reducing hydrogenase, delta subunit [bacterium BMS3Abin01]|nr:methyl-viologen-reducing hydrogenase, delta subunit [bacterium BMS3Abin01]HDY69950.1 hydrogenase iron-sulfur subunit [Actinomycetota bacterium]